MPKFLDDLKGKAQSAISATPLGAYVPGLEQHGPTQPASSAQGGRSYALGALQHQFRTLQVQYGSSTSKDARQLQLVITALKGIVLDFEKQAQDSKTVSKEFYMWGRQEGADVKDVTDRLAYLTYLQGSLAATLASSLDASRAPLKALRDAEAHLQPRRSVRLGYEYQISRLKNEAKPGTEQKVKELEMLLKKAEIDDEPLEKEIELIKRKAIVDSETQKWQALREYGEKLVLLSQACAPLVEALPNIPPTTARPYGGAASTAATRAALQRALDNYKLGDITLPAPSGVDRETRSFGETHASELSRINSIADHQRSAFGADTPSPPRSPPAHDLPPQPTAAPVASTAPAPVNPSDLNNAPAPIPSTSPDATAPNEPTSAVSGVSVPTNIPTVAETGIPLTSGEQGPGPASGTLARGQSSQGNVAPSEPGYGEPAPSYGGVDVTKYGLSDSGTSAKVESAEDEKKRLERDERERVLRGNVPGASASTTQESAEEEKKRLESEERERGLRAENSKGDNPDPGNGEGGNPPPYTEPS